MVRVHLGSPAATGRFGRALVRLLRPPALVTLTGELGTGKTTLIRAALHAAGVRGPVVSPSFTIAQSYTGFHGLRLNHLDLYRLSPGADVELFAWDDYLGADALTFVEWPEAGQAELPPADLTLSLFHDTRLTRWLEAEAAVSLEAALEAALEPEAPAGLEVSRS